MSEGADLNKLDHDTLKLEPVAKDHRGETWRIIFPGNREALLIFTKKGFYRGGHGHSRPETSLILQGKVRSWKKKLEKTTRIRLDEKVLDQIKIKSNDTIYEIDEDSEIVRDISAGEIMHNEAGEPHVTLALEDYWLLDFKIDSKIGEWTNMNYPPYRKLVDEQNPKP